MPVFVAEDKWVPADGLVLEPNAELAIKSHANILVLAGPGAGKTELLAQKACYLLQTGKCAPPHKILALSYKVDAAKNLANRVEKRCGKELARRFESRTYDSFAKQLLDQFRLALPEEYRPIKDYNIASTASDVEEIAKGYIKDDHPYHEFWMYEINKNVLMQKLTKSPLPLHDEGDRLYDWIVRKLWELLIHGKEKFQSTLTFPMISRLAEYLLRLNPSILAALRATYSHVFMDEFQDTTGVHYDLIKTAFHGSHIQLTAVGDEKQRIMIWAGALVNSFAQFVHDFHATKIHLTKNNRSAPRLVEIQNILTAEIWTSSVEVSASDKWQEENGICQVWTFGDHRQEAEYLASYLQEMIQIQKILPQEICILVRRNEQIYASALIDELKKRGIQARIEREYQELLAEEITYIFVNFLMLVSQHSNSSEAWQSLIDFLVDLNGFDPDDVKAQELLLKQEYALNDFIVSLRERVNQITTNNCKEKLIELFWIILKYFGLENVLCNFPKYSRGNSLEKKIEKVSEKMAESFAKNGNWIEAIEDFLGHTSIPIMTIHKSKGLEYDTVIFLGLEDDAFWSFNDQKEEDLCAFFVAFSRAKRQVIFTFSASRELPRGGQLREVHQDKIKISRFYQLLEKANVEIINKEYELISGKKMPIS